MAITDILFLFLFLPISLILYFLAGQALRKYVLLAVSLLFYACGSPDHFLLLLISLTITILLGWLINRYRERKMVAITFLIIGIAYNLGILFFYKYFDFIALNLSKVFRADFTARNLTLPLGLSFFTFKAISYLADTYNRKIEVKNNPVYAALYLSFFSQVQSGPLSRYEDMYSRDSKVRKFSFEDFSEGVWRFIIGFNKKILLANILANITQETFSMNPNDMSMSIAWLGAICYTMQLFFDFSGYSDMAIGISRMFGYQCPENFNYPYMTASVSEFWRRWHITLGAWFRDYVYIPLGGSRVRSRARLCLNLLAVWLLTGIWHGASWNFVFWGLGYFLVIAFEKLTGMPDRCKSKFGKSIYRVLTLLFVNFQWVIFRANGLGEGISYIKNMLLPAQKPVVDERAIFLLKDNLIFIVVAFLLCFPVIPMLQRWMEKRKGICMLWNIGLVCINIFLFVWAVSCLVAGQNNPFVYANF